MSLQYDEHRQYLADASRLDAFARALTAVVRPGDVVVDVGCGTGILGLLALRAGAARVYAIESGGMIDVARRIAIDNGVADRMRFIAGLSARVDLPEPVDVVVSDLMGRLGFEAGVMSASADAVRRWLKPGGRVLPERVDTWVAPVDAPELTAAVDFWRCRPEGFDMSAARPGAVNTGYPAELSAGMWLAPPQPVMSFDPAHPAAGRADAASGSVMFSVTRPGVVSGVGGWFRATLAHTVEMTNAPDDQRRIGRRQAFLPIDAPVSVVEGDVVEVHMRARPEEVVLAWEVCVRRNGRELARARQSTLAGMLVPAELLRRTSADSRPQLTRWAHARATVILLCDGAHTLREIEHRTKEAHPDLFVDLDAAAVFVAEVVTRYGHAPQD
ncbi:MAG: hypothetical protein AMXMBFR57_01640 [Acidimicrobiia bacterium]